MHLLVCSLNLSEMDNVVLYTTKRCDLLAGSRRNFFSGIWKKVCGRRVTRGWSDHAVMW